MKKLVFQCLFFLGACLVAVASPGWLTTVWQVEDGLPGNTVTCIMQTRDGYLWVGTHDGLARFDGIRFLSIGAHTRPEIRSNRISALLEDRGGSLWIGTDGGGVARMSDGQIETLTRWNGLPDDRVSALLLDASGEVVIQTPGGSRVWKNGELHHCENPVPEHHEPAFDVETPYPVACRFEDREGNRWAGTVGGGLLRLKRRRFMTIGAEAGLHVVSTAPDGADGTLLRLAAGNVVRWAPGDGVTPCSEAVQLPAGAGSGPLLRTSDGALWAGTGRAGLFRFLNGMVQCYGEDEGMAEQGILALFEDREKHLWIGTADAGLYRFKNGVFRHFGADDGLPARNIDALAQDRSGDLWIGSDGSGLYRYADGRFSLFCRREGWGSDFIRALRVDEDGSLWIGSGSGLTRMKDGWFHTMGTRQGLSSDLVAQLIEDDRGFLWVGTSRGLFRFRPEAFEAYANGSAALVDGASYGRSEGFQSLEFTGGFQPAACRTAEGALWFSTMKGAVRIPPGQPEEPVGGESVPVVHIETIFGDQQSVYDSIHDGSVPAALEIRPGTRRINIRYTGLSFGSPEELFFRYRLSGVDTSWIDAGRNRSAGYVGLKPGRYRFQVIAGSSDGVWNREGASLDVTVLPYFWQTTWFRWSAALAVLFFVGGMVRLAVMRRMHARLEAMQRRQALEEERARIARDIHDDAGARLTRISLLSSLMKRDLHDEQKLTGHIERIADAAHEVTESLDEVVWAVDPGNDTLEKLATYLSRFSEEFLAEVGIRCRLNIPSALPSLTLSSILRHNLFLVVKEALNNAAKYSGASTVRLGLRMEPGQLVVEVEDDGQGFDPCQIRRGHGLENMKTRMNALGGTLLLDCREGAGCRFTFTIQIQEKFIE